MKNICFYLFLLLSILAIQISFAQKHPKLPKKTNTFASNPKTDALNAIKEGRINMLAYGHPHEYEYQVIKDSMAALYGFSYVVVAGDIVEESLVVYTDRYNEVMVAHLGEKYGKDWEKCMYETISELWHEVLLKKETAEYLSEQYIALSGMISFEANQSEINELGKKLLLTNALGSQKADTYKDITEELSYISLMAVKSETESAEIVNARIENAKKILIAAGLRADRIIVKNEIDKSTDIQCDKCPGKRIAKKEGIFVNMEWK